MKNWVSFIAVAATVAVAALLPCGAKAQGNAFTYQGKLSLNGASASGNYVMVFSLYPTNAGGAIAAGPLTNAVPVTNGLFAAALDFGSGVFNGPNYWLDISVATNGVNSFTELLPRQPITPVPYALFAPNAGSASNVTGSVTLSQLPASVLTNNDASVNLTGVFNGNGAGLTNLPAASLTGTIANALLSSNVVVLPAQYPRTTVYQTAGVTTVVVPAGAATLTAKLWGAGGGGAEYGAGGGGAFVESTFAVTPGQTFVVVVGQHGDYNDNLAGGNGSGDAPGGNGAGGINGGQGGQASSLFNLTNGLYLMEAVAGGGGGAEYAAAGGAGGNPGQSGAVYANGTGAPTGGDNGTGGLRGTTDFTGNPGTNYAANATTTGLASLSAAGGSGGGTYVGTVYGGGGGGGYGGGGGGAGYDGGAGGGSYGQTILTGNGSLPGGTNDPNYLSANGNGGNGTVNGQDGRVVLTFGAAVTIPATITATGYIGNGDGLTNLPAASLTGTIANSLLSSNVVVVPAQYPATTVYQTAGMSTVVVPVGAATLTAKLWGAGGGGAEYGAGGGGAFVESTFAVTPGQTFVVVVGQHGDYNDNLAGGSGSGDAPGGNGAGGINGGQGGQASSLFNLTNGLYLMEAVAGGGGGAEYSAAGGAGGNPGQSGSVYANGTGAPTGGDNGTGGLRGTTDFTGNPGTNYAANATTTGLASLSAAGGSGGGAYVGTVYGGGGGGGYGGGGGGAGYDGGAGGGAYGQMILTGNGSLPGGTNDLNYLSANGNGGNGPVNGQDGLVVLTFGAGVTIPATVTATGFNGNGAGLTNLSAAAITGVIPQANLGTTNSFKPTIGNGSANFTMTTQSGYYALNGNLVYFEIWITWSSLNSVTSGTLAISLPPYPVASERAVFNLGYTGGITNTGVQMVPAVSAGTSVITLWCIPASGNGVNAVPVSNCAGSGQIQITGTYRWQ